MLLPSPLNAALGTTPSSMIGGRSPPMSAMSGGIGGGASSLGSIRSIGSTHEYVECTLQPMDSVVLTPSDAATKHSHAHSHSHSHQRHRSVSQSLSPLYEAPLQSSGDMELTPSPDPMAQAGNDSVTADDADADAALVANLTTTICMYHRASLSRAIYVSLLDRHDEMRELYSRHADFFRNIHSSLQSLCVDGNKAACVAASADLERLLFISRDEMPDLEWLSRLKALVGIVPSLWSHFKDIVGYDHAADEEMERLEHGEGASETPAVHSDAEHHPMAAGGAKNAAANASTDEADDADVEDADDPSSS
ncbi:hypothetical protein GQ42DRAFT_8311 [Ramicandelaber brevisporus]|nr:hypothetical protein GQ42DRAFT_8311 [Ramicandelaber brevisporus]